MKALRQKKIIDLINSYEIETQEELASKLGECGFEVTQATVSRDIRELRLNKVPGSAGRQRYTTEKNKDTDYDRRYISALKDAVISIESAENIIIIKTGAGMAMAVAAIVDALHIEGIMGCIAGDDTIMCVVKATVIVPEVMKGLSEHLSDYGNRL